MLWAILNKSWWHYPTRHQLYGHLPPIRKTIQVRRTRHAGHSWRSRDGLISDVLLWTPTYGREKVESSARIYIQQLCEDMGCSPEDLLEAMNDREKWRERVRDIRAGGTTWWLLYIYIYIYGVDSLSLNVECETEIQNLIAIFSPNKIRRVVVFIQAWTESYRIFGLFVYLQTCDRVSSHTPTTKKWVNREIS